MMILNITYKMNLIHSFRNISRLRLNQVSCLCTKVSQHEFVPIYKFPYIKVCGLVNRLKLYQSSLTAVSIPSSFVLYNFGVISADSVLTTCVLGITGTLSLFLFGMIPNKLIGFVYVKDDNKTAKISYLDFWGRRKNVEIPINDLVPLSDLPAITTDPIYLTMRRFSSPEIFKINLKYGIVLNKSKFNDVFLQDT